jgi:hypothetical protein
MGRAVQWRAGAPVAVGVTKAWKTQKPFMNLGSHPFLKKGIYEVGVVLVEVLVIVVEVIGLVVVVVVV